MFQVQPGAIAVLSLSLSLSPSQHPHCWGRQKSWHTIGEQGNVVCHGANTPDSIAKTWEEVPLWTSEVWCPAQRNSTFVQASELWPAHPNLQNLLVCTVGQQAYDNWSSAALRALHKDWSESLSHWQAERGKTQGPQMANSSTTMPWTWASHQAVAGRPRLVIK